MSEEMKDSRGISTGIRGDWRTIWVIAALGILTFYLCQRYLGYTEYIPVVQVFEKDYVLRERPELRSDEHIEAVIKVFDHYDESYKMENGTLYIKAPLQRDKDLLWNYTTKAETSLSDKVKNSGSEIGRID